MNAFERKKEAILKELSKPAEEYSDKSPKGSVDPQIRDLVNVINSHHGLVTTSSCSGRISVFLEGSKGAIGAGSKNSQPQSTSVEKDSAQDGQLLSSRGGGKGFGGQWLYVSHEPLLHDNEHVSLHKLFGLTEQESQLQHNTSANDLSARRLIHFKFEPLILHVLAADTTVAHHVLASAHQAGLRESGASNVEADGRRDGKPLLQQIPLAIRTTGMAFDNIIGHASRIAEERGELVDIYHSVVNEGYLHMLVAIANEKFVVNAEKMRRFREILQERFRGSTINAAWEDATVRKERKRKEGLQRRDRMLEMRRSQQSQEDPQIPEVD